MKRLLLLQLQKQSLAKVLLHYSLLLITSKKIPLQRRVKSEE